MCLTMAAPITKQRLPWWLSGKESTFNEGDTGSILGWGRSPEMQPTPVFFPGKSHGQRSLAGYSPRGYKRVRQDLATKTAKQITKETLQKFMEKQKDTSCQKLHFTTFGPKQIK